MECGGVKLTKCHIFLLVTSLICLFFAVFSIPMLNQLIRHRVMLIPGSQTYDEWIEPTIPIYAQFYMFDLQNPSEVMSGAKPSVVQRGPYTYREHRKKADIVHHENGTVTYRQIKTYKFVRNMSVGPDSDVITTVNIPIVTLANFAKWNGAGWQSLVNLASHLGGKIFISKTVREMAFGYHDRFLTLGMTFDSHRFYTDLVGILAGKNNTDDGVYTVFTGENDINKLGFIDRYNGSSSLKFWTSACANMINGSDGTVVAPFTKTSQTLYMFSTDICRSVYGVYSGQVQSKYGINLYRFTATKDVIANASENPANEGFCTPKGNCMGSGVLNLTTCQNLDHFPVPLVASFPHFYMADPRYINAINGMKPDPTQHSTNVDVEPTSGIVMQIAKRLQVNVYMENSTVMKDFKDIRPMVYPICWINESAVIDSDLSNRVHKQLLTPMRIVYITQYVLYGLGGTLFIIFAIYLAVTIKKQERASVSVNADDPEESENSDDSLDPEGSNDREALLT